MEKDEFVLKVQDLRDLFNTDNHDWAEEMFEIGYRTSIEAWEPSGDYMIDDHITGYYPELQTLQIYEEMEGTMFSTIQGAPALVSALRRMGFNAELVNPEDHSEPIVREPSVEELEAEMRDAVSQDTEEGYMKAARLRDRIRDILRKERGES